MKKLVFFLLVLLCANSAYAISADLGQIGVGARPLSMGKAYTGYASDASSIFMNPAGLAETPSLKISSMTGKLLDEVSYVSLSIAGPTRYGTFGIGYINAGSAGIPLTNLTTYPSGTFEVNQYDTTDYSSSVLYLSYANKPLENLSFGGSLKLFTQGFSKDTGAMEGSNGTGMDLDFGTEWNVSKYLNLGFVGQNLLPMSAGGKFTWKKGSLEEGIPAVLKFGTSVNLIGKDGFKKIGEHQLFLALDSEINPTLKRPGLWHLGAEWWPVGSIAVRFGIDQSPKAVEAGVGVESNLTAGLGLKYKGFTFDYAYHQFGPYTENASHFFSIGYQGVEIKPMMKIIEEKRKELEKEGLYLKTQEKPVLKTFFDVPKVYWAKDPIEYVTTLNLMSGYPDGTFHPESAMMRRDLTALLAEKKMKVASPDKPLTRGDGVVLIVKYAGFKVPKKLSSNPYPDVSKKLDSARYISAAKNAGLLEFISGSKFQPNKKLTRAEAAEMISKVPSVKDRILDLIK